MICCNFRISSSEKYCTTVPLARERMMSYCSWNSGEEIMGFTNMREEEGNISSYVDGMHQKNCDVIKQSLPRFGRVFQDDSRSQCGLMAGRYHCDLK